ncbi:MAG: hypothetical protein HFH27_12515 [Clostridiaceae bacterium]|nr:hypothetical protein [Clostridiaceae bacterium]
MNLYRLTTNGMLYSYRANLQNSYRTLADAMTKVQTNRNFNSYAEDPAAASRAFTLRREHWQASAQVRNNDCVLTSFRQAWSTIDSVKNDLVTQKGKVNTLRGLNDPDGTARKTLGQSTLAAAEAAVQSMNVKYDGKFLFAGADGLNAPLTWEEMPVIDTVGTQRVCDAASDGQVLKFYTEDTPAVDAAGNPIIDPATNEQLIYKKGEPVLVDDGTGTGGTVQACYAEGEKIFDKNGDPVMEGIGEPKKDADGNVVTEKKLCYRGVPVDSPEKITVQKKDADGNPEVDADGNPVYETIDNPDYKKLKDMMGETTYVDIGLGMQENPDGTPIKSTVYNSALSGLEFLDFGVDEDGDPKNVISLMQKIGDHLMKASDMDGQWVQDPETKEWTNNSEAYKVLNRLCGKLEKAINKMDVEYDELDTKAAFLDGNSTRLTADVKALNEQILGIEEIDPVAAITSLSWAQYCYNAGLKIGTSILSQSLIDYMN